MPIIWYSSFWHCGWQAWFRWIWAHFTPSHYVVFVIYSAWCAMSRCAVVVLTATSPSRRRFIERSLHISLAQGPSRCIIGDYFDYIFWQDHTIIEELRKDAFPSSELHGLLRKKNSRRRWRVIMFCVRWALAPGSWMPLAFLLPS